MGSKERQYCPLHILTIKEARSSTQGEIANDQPHRDRKTPLSFDVCTTVSDPDLFCLFALALSICWLAVEEYQHKSQPASNRYPDTRDPDPSSTDLPTAWILIVREVAHGDFAFDIDICEEWSFVINSKSKYAVLIRCLEGSAKDGAVKSFGIGFEFEAVEGGEHAEFQLEGVRWGNGERVQASEGVF